MVLEADMQIKHGKNLILKDKNTVYIDPTVIIGNNVTIYENNRIEGNTVIGDGVTIFPNNRIIDSSIGENSVIDNSYLEKATVGRECKIGPFSRLRPDAVISDNACIGNFVEVKNSIVGKKTKASHLAYIGDAEIGENCNIGCGAIFVNYNGRKKQRSKIGNNCFIGSNCNIIAPVKIENDTYVCAGTTVTEDIESGAFVIGRVRQEVKSGRAHKYLKDVNKESKGE